MTENELIKRHTGLIVIQAALFAPTSLSDFDDYMSAGRIGLLKAIRNYDSTKGNAFSTYAIPCIRREIIREAGRDKKPKTQFCNTNLTSIPTEGIDDWTEILPITLDHIEKTVVLMRADGHTLDDIGQVFGHTKQWVSNKLQKIFQKIRQSYE